MNSVFDVRYSGEIADMELIKEKYRVDDYIEAVEEKKNSAQESLSAVFSSLPIVSRDMFPRLYRIVDIVLERLGMSEISYELRLTDRRDLQIGFICDGDDLVFCISPEAISVYEDDELAFFFGRCVAQSVWGIEKLMNLECRIGNVDDEMDYEDGESVLPGLGNVLYKRWRIKSEISLDRVGIIAAGGLDPAIKAMFRAEALKGAGKEGVMLHPLKSSDIHIPPMDRFAQLHADSTPDEGVYFRAYALCLFGQKWFSPSRDDDTFREIDRQIDEKFEIISKKIDDDSKLFVPIFLLKTLEAQTINGRKPTEKELREIVKILNYYTDDPSEISEIFENIESILECGRKIYRKILKELSSGATDDFCEVYKLICQGVLSGCGLVSEKSEYLEKVAKDLRIPDRKAVELTNEIVDSLGEGFYDPLAEEIVDQVMTKFNGKSICKRMPCRVDSGDAESVYRYCGDIEGERILRDLYDADRYVGNYEKMLTCGMMDTRDFENLRNGVRLTENTSPRVYDVVRRVCKRLKIKIPFDVFCKNSYEVNAFARFQYHHGKKTGLICINSASLELLNDDELAYLVGHELGHLIHDHVKWRAVQCEEYEDGTLKTNLPQMGEIVYNEWQQKNEISCDRAGAIAAGSKAAALSAQAKIAYGLSGKNFNINGVDDLLEQIREIKDDSVVDGCNFGSHPIDPLRMKALNLFCKAYYADDFNAEKLAEVDDEIGRYYQWIRRNPRTKIDQAYMRAYVDAGVEMLLADGVLDRNEISNICKELNGLTCEPVGEFIVDKKKRLARLSSSIKALKEAREDVKHELLRMLVNLALSDGSITRPERLYLKKFAARIGIDADVANKLITNTVASIGFPSDTLFNERVECLAKAVSRMIKNK